jgi:LEA14-like dessication related protein
MRQFYITILFIVYMTTKVQAFSAPMYKRMEGWKVDKVGFSEISLTNTIVMYNPNKVGCVKLTKVYFDVFLDNAKIGNITQTEKVKLKQNSEFSIPLKLTIQPQEGILNNLGSILGLLTKSASITYDGQIKIVAWLIFPYTAKVKDTLSISLKDLMR